MSVRALSIRRLLALMVLLTLCGASVAGVLALRATRSATTAEKSLTTYTVARNEIDRFSLLDSQSQYYSLVVSAYPGFAAQTVPQLKVIATEMAQVVTTLNNTKLSVKVHASVQAIVKAHDAFQALAGQKLPVATADQRAVVAKLYTAAQATQTAAVDAATALLASSVTQQRHITQQAVQRLTVLLFGVSIGGGVVLVLALVLTGNRLVRRIAMLSDALNGLAGGDLTTAVNDGGNDEVSQMAKRLNGLATRLREVFSLIDQTSDRLAQSSTSLEEVAGDVAASALDASSQAATAAQAADEVSQNVQAVATGSEEMRASIGEIARNAHEAAAVATGAVAAVELTTATMGTLGDSTKQISDVVNLITAIAEQTNLLALNATIEAARAGAAGRGFAVVADEVKQLAQETARATGDISARVQTIQTDAAEAASSISGVAEVIARIKDLQVTIAASVEEQTATTRAMNMGVNDAATGSQEIARNISGVAETTRLAADSVEQARTSARELATMSQELAEIVAAFQFR
jgi:methyl-accepting chemotaxis protein